MADVECPCCGTVVEATWEPLVAVADVVVLRALEVAGKRVAGRDRSLRGRLQAEGVAPWRVHTLVRPDLPTVLRALDGAWDALPFLVDEYGCCGATPEQVEAVLSRYARDLLLTGQEHRTSELRVRLGAYLGLDLPAS